MKNHIFLLALFTLLGFSASMPARGAAITLSFQDASPQGTPGQTLQFFATLSNLTGSEQFLGSLNASGLTPDFVVDTNPFLLNAPLSLQSNEVSGLFNLMTITIPDVISPGTFNGSVVLLGGLTADAQDVLGSADFSVQVTPAAVTTPEPSSSLLMGAGVLALSAAAARSAMKTEKVSAEGIDRSGGPRLSRG
jgi:hypothetical protein